MRDKDCDTCYGISCPHWMQCFPELVTDVKELEAKNKKLQLAGIEMMGRINKLEKRINRKE